MHQSHCKIYVAIMCLIPPDHMTIWAATWQNQQNDSAPSEDLEQPGHPPSLISVFAVRMKKAWVLSYPLSAQGRLIRLGGCPGWSESSLSAHSFCWLSCRGSFYHICRHPLSIKRRQSDLYIYFFLNGFLCDLSLILFIKSYAFACF